MLAAFTCSHFRNLTQLEWTPGEGVHLVLGKNGAGKSSLLEAIYLLATTRSFRTAKLADCVQHEQQAFCLRGEIESERRVKLEATWIDGRRSRQVNGERVGLVEHLGVLPVVAWSSAEEEVISGSPAHRRRFIDRGIVSSRPAALGVLRNFRRAIEQKRHLLTTRGEGIEAWNEVLAAAILDLGSLRQGWVERLAAAIQEVVTTAALSVPKIEVFFRPSVAGADNGITEILEQLSRWSEREQRRRRPLVGSHRDDLEILWGGREARRVASAGERKLIGLILTAARAHLLKAAGREPICLLDDADSDLDQERLEAARSLFIGCKQVMISSSRAEPWETWGKAHFWRLHEGFLAPMDGRAGEPKNVL